MTVAQLIAAKPSEEVRHELEKARFALVAIATDLDNPPYQLIESSLGAASATDTVPGLVAAAFIILSDARLAGIPTLSTSGDLGQEALHAESISPSDGKFRNSTIQFFVSAPTIREFTRLSIARFYLERRLEHLADIFSAQNELYPLDEISLYFIERPGDWTEHRFTVDPARVMRLLMGRELYGTGSQDIWFRELLQNAFDATNVRQQLEDHGIYERQISVFLNSGERCIIFEDNGVGMTKDHILRFFCRAGRSIWRSDEFKSFNAKRVGEPTRTSLGKFGVGFLSVFQVADRVAVQTAFFKDDAGGHSLVLTDLEKPFFLSPDPMLPPGARVTLYFKSGYEPNIDKLAENYITYRPAGVHLHGLPNVPANAREALSAILRRTPLRSNKNFKGVRWQIAHRVLSNLEFPSLYCCSYDMVWGR